MKLRILFLICFLSVAATADTLSLAGTVELGLKHNFGIRIRKAEEEKAVNNKRLKTGALLPTLRLDGAGTKTSTHYFSSTPPGAAGTTDELRIGGVLNWTLFDGFRMFHAAHQIDQQAELAGLATRRQIETGVASIMTAYYELVAKRALLAAAKEQLVLSREHLVLVRAQYEYGRVGRRELLTQEVTFNSDSSAWLAQLLAERSALYAVNLAIGREPDFQFECNNDTSSTLPSDSPSQWFEETLKHNSGLQMSLVQKQISVTRHALASSAVWPVVSANGSLYAISQNDNNLSRAQAGLSVSLPIFSGFTTSTAIKNSVLDTVSASLSIEESKLELQALVYEQYDRLAISATQIEFEKKAIERARESLQLSEEQFRLGRISDITLREAQQALLQAQVRYQTALFQNRIVAVQLRQLAGKILVQ